MSTNQTTYNTIKNSYFDHDITKEPKSHDINSLYLPYEDNNYRIKYHLKGKNLLDSYRLRASVFCHELKWVGNNDTEFEVDEFDKKSSHIGIIDSREDVVGTLRLTSHENYWFMEKYFTNLLPGNFQKMKLPSSIEATRLAVDNGLRAQPIKDQKGIVDLLYKGAFCYCQTHEISHIYIIASISILKFMRLHRMPVRAIGEITTMPDGIEAVAAVIDWGALFHSNNLKDKKFLEWLKKPIQRRNELLWRQPESDLLH